MTVIYLDNNATTQVDAAVLEAMLPYLPRALRQPLQHAHLRRAGGPAAAGGPGAGGGLLGAAPDEIIFTSCGSESDNTAIRSALATFPASATSSPPGWSTRPSTPWWPTWPRKVTGSPNCRWTARAANLDQYDQALTPDTAIASLMWANNETGVIFPVEQAAALARNKGILFHTDAVQAVGKIPIDLRQNSIDMLSLSGHKLHAAKGVGVLYVRKGTKFAPLLIGGHQEKGRRGGTENVPSIIGLGVACQLAAQRMDEENTRVKALRDKLENALLAGIPKSRVNGDRVQRLPNTSNISFESIEGEAILLLINELGICASSGSACTSGSLQPSHVLRAMGVPFTMAHGSIRFSLSVFNTEREIDYVVEKFPLIIEKLRALSPYWGVGEAVCATMEG